MQGTWFIQPAISPKDHQPDPGQLGMLILCGQLKYFLFQLLPGKMRTGLKTQGIKCRKQPFKMQGNQGNPAFLQPHGFKNPIPIPKPAVICRNDGCTGIQPFSIETDLVHLAKLKNAPL